MPTITEIIPGQRYRNTMNGRVFVATDRFIVLSSRVYVRDSGPYKGTETSMSDKTALLTMELMEDEAAGSLGL